MTEFVVGVFVEAKIIIFSRKVQDRFFVVSKGGPGGTFVDSCTLSTDFRDPPGYPKMSLFGHLLNHSQRNESQSLRLRMGNECENFLFLSLRNVFFKIKCM